MITAIFDNGERFTACRPHGLRFLGTLGPNSIAGYIINPQSERIIEASAPKRPRKPTKGNP